MGRGVPRILVTIVMVMLAGCASKPTTRTADDAVCRKEAYNDPHVKALIARSVPGITNNIFDFSFSDPQTDAQYAYRQAVQACLVRRGLATAGGVEPVRQYPFGPLGY
jgi:hypothetical protein